MWMQEWKTVACNEHTFLIHKISPEQLFISLQEIPEQLFMAAENNLCLHLGKLIKEGRVTEKNDLYTAVLKVDNKL